MLQLDVVLIVVPLVTFACLILRHRKSGPFSHLPLPPGPRGLPFIGNLRDLPSNFEWFTYHKWCKEFDTDILHLNIAGTSVIVLDSYEAAIQLLEKRSSIYSNRPRFTMVNELMGWDFNAAFMDYVESTFLQAGASTSFASKSPTRPCRLLRPHSLKAARNLLNRFLDIPDDVVVNIRHMAGETIMAVAYGLQVRPKDDHYIQIAERAVHRFVAAAVPGTFLVDSLPILKYVPAWMPGAGFRRKAREWKKLARDMLEVPFAAAKRNIAAGVQVCPPSFTSITLQEVEEDVDSASYREDAIQASAGSMYIAGSDTTLSAVASCILGLLDSPEVVRKAQEELDRVLKPGQLPDFDDEDSLPYITAITKESLRWRDVVPIAIPRLLNVDDEYKGYRLPAGSIIIANAWVMLHNEEIYVDPFTFNPDRFMKDGKIDHSVWDPSCMCWGFGRRNCPGRHMAYSSVWINIASILSVFDIKKAVDENEDIVEPSHEYSSGLICVPKPYPCSIIPRSEEAERLIRTYAN